MPADGCRAAVRDALLRGPEGVPPGLSPDPMQDNEAQPRAGIGHARPAVGWRRGGCQQAAERVKLAFRSAGAFGLRDPGGQILGGPVAGGAGV